MQLSEPAHLAPAYRPKVMRHFAPKRLLSSVRIRTKEVVMRMPKEYASFSSLIWSRVAHTSYTWRWKNYLVWGVGCDSRGVGGTWYSSASGTVGYKTQFDAQAAVEHYELCKTPPPFLMDDVDLVWDCLAAGELTFEQLQTATKLSDGRLSGALGRCYELSILRMSILTGVVGYLRATERRK